MGSSKRKADPAPEAATASFATGPLRARGGPRPGSGRPPSGRDDVSVKMDRDLAATCRFVADRRKITLAEYLTESMRKIAERDFAKETGKASGAGGGAGA